MKKLILFFAVIYFVYSSSECNSETSPKDAATCYKLGAGETDNTCCFFEQTKEGIKRCYELPKDATKREEYIKVNYPEFTSYTYTCFGSFLKTSLLLLTSLILL